MKSIKKSGSWLFFLFVCFVFRFLGVCTDLIMQVTIFFCSGNKILVTLFPFVNKSSGRCVVGWLFFFNSVL